jgi:hypothetical protein
LSDVSRLLGFKLPALEIVEAILHGRQAEGMAMPGLMEPSPVERGRQLWTTAHCPAAIRSNADARNAE